MKVAVIYHLWPHYRRGVMQAMDRSHSVKYYFHGSGKPLDGIAHVDPAAVRHFISAPFVRLAGWLWQPGAITATRRGGYDAVIFLADPHFLSTWIAALLARLRGMGVLFWGHGWPRREAWHKGLLRRLYFSLSHRFLAYAERGRRIGIEAGFPASRIAVVYNSLDLGRADAVVAAVEAGRLPLRPQRFFAEPDRPLLICTARLTARCRLDLLIEAAARLAERGLPVNLLLVGDGPEHAALRGRAARLGVAAHFTGACHDEEVVGPLIYHADLTVSPGKIGLTAIHSLMYGTPAITHGDLDAQMPEVEAIEPGVTGAFFRRGDALSLVDAIEAWLRGGPPRARVRAAARAEIRVRWSPEVQAGIIERAVLAVAGRA